jgi:hypothetical protein
VEGLGPATAPQPYGGGLAGLGDDIGAALTEAGDPGAGGWPAQPPPGAVPLAPVPDGYATRVDADGDGDWDRHLLLGRAGGGVDILVDVDSDGRADFIGHDTDADGLVDSAEYDRDRDGFFERRSYDDDGDGWLDRSETYDAPPVTADLDPEPDGGVVGGGLVGRNLRLPDYG